MVKEDTQRKNGQRTEEEINIGVWYFNHVSSGNEKTDHRTGR